jgi:GntR family transcriptional repressor for pyruvate dehydrogenase complex
MVGVAPSERAAIKVARQIVNDIQKRALRPGTKLDPEHVMVKNFGVSRATVREALRFLEIQGTLRIKAGVGGGPVVNVPDIDNLTSAISLQLQFANASFKSVLDARRSLYPIVVAEAAENANHQDLSALRASVEKLDEVVGDPDAHTHEARLFYELVAAASKNLVLGFLVNALHRMSQRSGIEYDLEHRRAHAKNSKLILEAIEAGKAEEARLISYRMHAASSRYWEKHAPDLLETPVSWIT